MFYRFTLLFPLVCLTLAPSSLAWAADPENVVTDEQILRTVGLSCDGPALVQFLRNRSLGEFDRKEIEALVDKLDSPQAEERDRAAGELVARGARPSRCCARRCGTRMLPESLPGHAAACNTWRAIRAPFCPLPLSVCWRKRNQPVRSRPCWTICPLPTTRRFSMRSRRPWAR